MKFVNLLVKIPLLLSIIGFTLAVRAEALLVSEEFQSKSDGGVDDFEAIVVTGTRTGKKLKEDPVKTELLDQNQIHEQHYRDVSEAILDVPGITLSGQGGKQGKSAIIQGLGGDHVLLVIDGVPVSQNSNNGFDLTQISTADIQQIEVVKGGASALYGGQAIGGVINVITRRPTTVPKYGVEVIRDQHLSGKHKQDLGYNVLKGYFNKREGNTSYKLSVTNNQSSSIDRDKSTLTRDTPDLNKIMGDIALSQRLNSKNSLSGDFNYYREENKTYGAKLRPDSTFQEVHNEGNLTNQRFKLGHSFTPNENLSLQSYALYEKINDKLTMEDDPTTPYVESLKTSEMTHKRVEIQGSMAIGDSHIVTGGIVYDQNDLKQDTKTSSNASSSHSSVEINGKKAERLEGFIQDDWPMNGGHEIITGVRYTQDLSFGSNLSPKINYSKTFDLGGETTSVIRSSIGSGFRVPSLKERFYVLDHRSFAGYIVLGNDQLRPETSVSYQLGWEISKKGKYTFGVNGFLNVVDGLIMTKEISTGSTERTFTYENVDSARIKGIELNGDYFFGDHFKISQSFTYSRAENGNDGYVIPNRPFYIAQTIAKYSFANPSLDLIYTFRFFGESYGNVENTKRYDGFATSDLRMNYHYNKSTTYFLGIKNMFDVTRAPLKDETDITYDQKPSLGRMLLIGFVYDV